MRQELLHAAREASAIRGDADEYWERYFVDFKLARNDRQAALRSAWIIRRSEEFPRVTTSP
jgi:uncharacterized protein DUF6883